MTDIFTVPPGTVMRLRIGGYRDLYHDMQFKHIIDGARIMDDEFIFVLATLITDRKRQNETFVQAHLILAQRGTTGWVWNLDLEADDNDDPGVFVYNPETSADHV